MKVIARKEYSFIPIHVDLVLETKEELLALYHILDTRAISEGVGTVYGVYLSSLLAELDDHIEIVDKKIRDQLFISFMRELKHNMRNVKV